MFCHGRALLGALTNSPPATVHFDGECRNAFLRSYQGNLAQTFTKALLAVKVQSECERIRPQNENYAKRRYTVLDRTNEDVADRVAALVRKMLDREKINKAVGADDDLRGSGLSSIGLVNLMLSVESEFDLTIPERDMTPGNFRSITRIAELVDTVSQRPATA
jgi:acyl carrier protein